MNAEAPNNHFDRSSEAQARRARSRYGDRQKLAKAYFADVYSVWEEQGIDAVRRMAFHDPSGFVKVIAGLMPQKLEISHPTDGLSDERLAILLEAAEAMAKRLGSVGQSAIDEKRLIDVTPKGRGGGPERSGDAAGRVVDTLPAPAAAPIEADASNGLDGDTSNKLVDATCTSESLIAEESNYATHPPVGRPCALTPQQEQRVNLRKLNESDVDPSSLF